MNVTKAKLFIVFILSIFISACGQAKEPKEKLEDIGQAFDKSKEASIYAMYNQFILTNSVFKAAYSEADRQSKTNDALLDFAGAQINIIKVNYEALDKNLLEDLESLASGKRSIITVQAVDGMCVNNKFIKKYSKAVDFNKFPKYVKEYSEQALSLQPKIEEILEKEAQSPIGGSICNTLQ